jgi:hypothetical protein
MRLGVFLFFVAIFAATTAGHIYTIDSYLNYAVTKSVGTRGALDVPKFMMTVEGRGGKQYSKLGVGQSLVSLPLFWTGSLVERLAPDNRLFRVYADRVNIPHDGGTVVAVPQDLIRASDIEGARIFFTALTGAFVSAIVCLLFWILLRRFGLSRRGALWGACLLGFATPLWVYSRDLFAEPLFSACLLGAFCLVTDPSGAGVARRMVLAGLVSSLGVLARASFIPIAVILACYLVLATADRGLGLRHAAWYAAGCLPGLVIAGSLNVWRFGGLFLSGYHTAFDRGFSVPLWKGLLWNLASPYRSILLYAPGVVIFALGFREFLRRHKRETWLAVALISYLFVIYSKWWAWHGGWCWGPRFLLPAIPLLLLPGLAAARTRKWLIATAAILGVAGLAVQISGVLINYTAPYDYWIKIKKLDWAEENIQGFSPIWVHMKALFATSPRHYDLWIIQAWKVIGWKVIWMGLGLAALAGLSATYVLRPSRRT